MEIRLMFPGVENTYLFDTIDYSPSTTVMDGYITRLNTWPVKFTRKVWKAKGGHWSVNIGTQKICFMVEMEEVK